MHTIMAIRNVRVDGQEWATWKAEAATFGLSLGEVIREATRERLRFIRAQKSANNAASDPEQISSNETQSRDLEAGQGGEAKEASGPESLAKPGGPA